MRNGRVAPPSTLMSVEEDMQAAGVGKNTAYQIIKKLNTDLDAMGKLTFRGRVNRKFFEERFGYEGRQS